ncbi:hypothetical protein ABZX69_25915 [Streptomyces sp. NPDC004074]|uniref:hypothetical protein n=1 Tax=unclassified Streptomyces TaxID=2593676 RepID=UPI0033A49D58
MTTVELTEPTQPRNRVVGLVGAGQGDLGSRQRAFRRSAAEIGTGLETTHSEHGITTTVVRTALESLVAKKQATPADTSDVYPFRWSSICRQSVPRALHGHGADSDFPALGRFLTIR